MDREFWMFVVDGKQRLFPHFNPHTMRMEMVFLIARNEDIAIRAAKFLSTKSHKPVSVARIGTAPGELNAQIDLAKSAGAVRVECVAGFESDGLPDFEEFLSLDGSRRE